MWASIRPWYTISVVDEQACDVDVRDTWRTVQFTVVHEFRPVVLVSTYCSAMFWCACFCTHLSKPVTSCVRDNYATAVHNHLLGLTAFHREVIQMCTTHKVLLLMPFCKCIFVPHTATGRCPALWALSGTDLKETGAATVVTTMGLWYTIGVLEVQPWSMRPGLWTTHPIHTP